MPNKSQNIRLKSSQDRLELIAKLTQKRYPQVFAWMHDCDVRIISPKTILKFIDDELKHDNSAIEERWGQPLTTMSSGERKRAYLHYILALKPQVLVLDHFFDNLDIEAKVVLAELLQKQDELSIVNLYSRTGDELAFLAEHFVYAPNELKTFDEKLLETKTLATGIALPDPIEFARPTDNCLVEFRAVSVSYGEKQILSKVNWKVNKGEFWHLRGPNGSGKTTMLSMIVGDNPKAYGQELYLFGKRKGTGESIWDIKRQIGYFTSNMTFQFWRMQPILDMIVSGFYDSIGLYTTPGDHQLHLAKRWLQFLGLEKFANKPFVKMSLCHQRMVMIARAMVKHPPLLILDEPSVDLDEASAALIADLINRIAHESDTTVIYVSHRGEPGLVASHVLDLHMEEDGSKAVLSV